MIEKSKRFLDKLCLQIPARLVGSAGNQQAVDFFRSVVEGFDWQVSGSEFPAFDWGEEGADLEINQESFSVFPSPYSPEISITAELKAAGDLAELKGLDCSGKLLLIHGQLAKEQLMPKNFIFYNPREHQELIEILEQKKPAAILTATAHDGAVAGGIYPFPMIEDGDFMIPSVYLSDEEGKKLLRQIGNTAKLVSRTWSRNSQGCQLIAIKGADPGRRIIITAHIDAKIGTPGAIDNGTGVVVLLLLAELFKDHQIGPVIELVPLNGEDYYSVPGQMVFLAQNQGRFDEMLININIDGAGYQKGPTAFSPFNLPEGIRDTLDHVLDASDQLVEGEPWVQGDHSIFIQQGVPAIAVSSDWFIKNISKQRITHTPADHPGIVDHDRVIEAARAIQAFIQQAYLK